jgi:GNAT superfamily N-acetyltransferase
MQSEHSSQAIPFEIVSFADVERSPNLIAALDEIFFEASATRSFDSERHRACFRERWLGRYLEHEAEHTFLALDASSRPAGYVVGDIVDPASKPLYADIPYVQALAASTRRYPAHLHINLAPAHRSRGIGSRLIETFASHAAARGAPGVHIVTSKGARNVGFYERNGFLLRQEIAWADRALVLLGRDLSGSTRGAPAAAISPRNQGLSPQRRLT